LDHCDIEWFALETNRDHSIVLMDTTLQIKTKRFFKYIDLKGLVEDNLILTCLCIQSAANHTPCGLWKKPHSWEEMRMKKGLPVLCGK